MKIKSLVPLLSLALLQACGGSDDDNPAFKTLSGNAPLVIGHRGSSGTLPEHTLESYKAAIEQGADYIEPDLVLTKDGVMIARHEPVLDGTTDVASKFPESRKSTRNLDGVPTTAYFASDFTIAEIRTLRAVQARANRSQAYNGLFGIPTLDEVIALAKSEGTRLGRTVGIYPEIKHSTFHADEVRFGANVFEDKLLTTLHTAYGNVASAPVFIQSFEVSNLQYLNTKTNIKLVQLIDADDGSRWGVVDCLVIEQGPNYALAKRLQQWRALAVRAAGHVASINVAPSTTTASVLSNPALAAGFRGAKAFDIEVFQPDTTHALMAAMWVHDLRNPQSSAQPGVALPHPLQLLVDGANHGGLWRVPYLPRSVLPFAALLGMMKRS